jgi:nitrite reductase/ring-hydroxylating ferredoxin subunit
MKLGSEEAGITHWIPVPEAEALAPNESTTIIVNGTDVALCRDEEHYYALSNRCPHRQGQIGDGRVENGRAYCPLHDWDFDLRTGISPYNPLDRLDCYELRETGNGVEVGEESVPPTPATGYLRDYQGRYRRFVDDVERDYETIQDFGRYGTGHVDAMRTKRQVPNFDAIQFRPAQLASQPLLDEESITLGVTLGAKSKHPITLSIPVLIAHMSFGALSAEAKVALAQASTEAGIAICSGEGGILPAERDAASIYILEMASGYFGWTEENIGRADAIEIKIGQAAKAGSGGILPGAKVTPEIAKVRGIPPGTTAHSPARFPDINTPQELAQRVAEIRRMTDGRPVGIKDRGGQAGGGPGGGPGVGSGLDHDRRQAGRHRRSTNPSQGPRRNPHGVCRGPRTTLLRSLPRARHRSDHHRRVAHPCRLRQGDRDGHGRGGDSHLRPGGDRLPAVPCLPYGKLPRWDRDTTQ